MSIAEQSISAKIRSGLSHPIIDCDGHWIEPMQVLVDYVKKIGGSSIGDKYERILKARQTGWYGMSPEERRQKRFVRPGFWMAPAETLDKATTMLPSLLHKRLDDFGIDFSIILPSRIQNLSQISDQPLRAAVIRSLNVMHAELFAPFSDRIIPVAAIPTVRPDEAIEEAEFCVKELGLKVALIDGSIMRPIGSAKDAEVGPGASSGYYIDNLALDSPYDYDPLWAKLEELKLAPMTHSRSSGWVDRSSPTNYVYNHIGHFAQSAHDFAKALFLGGVVNRFPNLNFAFLECGVGWARSLCCDLVGHYEKRSKEPLLKNLSPANIDVPLLIKLLNENGGEWLTSREDFMQNIDTHSPNVSLDELVAREGDDFDDFAATGCTSKADIRASFAKNFYFGCEADDPISTLAFDTRLGPKLNALFSSDVSHWDVIDMSTVLEEAYEMVDHGLFSEGEFREFTFSNPIAFHCRSNPDFFNGTVIEKAVKAELEKTATPLSA